MNDAQTRTVPRTVPRTVLLVDRNPRNLQLLMDVLGDHGFATRCAPDLARIDALIAEAVPIAAALVDVDGFDPAIWERCRRLHDCKVEVLVVVSRCAVALAQAHCARCGARAVLSKPLSPKHLAEMVRGLIEEPA